MYSSKLLNLIRTFNEKEQSQLLKFVRFNNKSNGYNIVLLEQILKESPYFTSEKLKKEEVFKQVYPKKTKYNDVVLRRCMSRLFYLCEDFVVHLKVQEDERVKQLYLMEYYEENKMEQHFGGVLRKWKHKEEGKVAVGDRFFYEEFLLEREVSMHIVRKQDRTVEPNLKQISYNLDAFYLMHKLKVCCTSLNYQVLSNVEYELPLMEEVVDYLEKEWEVCHPIVQAYYFALLTLKDSEDKLHFQNLKKILFENLVLFDSEEQGNLFKLAQNYCIKRINKGEKQYLNELLELYKIGLETEVVIENGQLSTFDYKNIVTLGTRLKVYDWTEEFIKKYEDKLEKSLRESAYHYNLARLYFSKKEFEKVIELLRQVEHREIFVDLSAKVLLLKTYYELEEIEPMISLMESFRMFLSRKKNIGYHKNRYQNFLKFLRRLMRLQVASDSKKEAFIEAVQNTKELIEKDWFLEKIE